MQNATSLDAFMPLDEEEKERVKQFVHMMKDSLLDNFTWRTGCSVYDAVGWMRPVQTPPRSFLYVIFQHRGVFRGGAQGAGATPSSSGHN